MATKNVLIIGQEDDPHVASVTAAIKNMGAVPELLDVAFARVSIDLSSRAKSFFSPAGDLSRRVGFEEIHSVWYRLKRRCEHIADTSEQRAEARFEWAEWMSLVESLSFIAAPTRWVNSHSIGRAMASKATQKTIAVKVGLRVPDTAVTNNPDSVLDLFSRHERLIYKSLRSAELSDCRGIFTTEISKSQVLSSARQIRVAPGIFQELIEKDHELRVTVVGEKLFSVRIDSQKIANTQLDWRRSMLGKELHEEVEIPEDLAVKILQFHKCSGLIYGAYDIVVPKIGEPVFLEVNPAGQWMWMEEMLGLPISLEIAKSLVSG